MLYRLSIYSTWLTSCLALLVMVFPHRCSLRYRNFGSLCVLKEAVEGGWSADW